MKYPIIKEVNVLEDNNIKGVMEGSSRTNVTCDHLTEDIGDSLIINQRIRSIWNESKD